MPSEKHFLYHLIISQLYHDGFGPHATLLEEAALNTNRAIAPSDRLKQMLSACAHTVREVDDYFNQTSAKDEHINRVSNIMIGERPMRSSTPSSYHTLARRRLTAAKRHSVLAVNRGKYMRSNSRNFMSYPKSSHIPIITSSMSTSEASGESHCQTISSSNVNALQNLFGPSPTDNSLFTNADKDHSVEAVRVLQNIFQRDRLPNVPSITSVHSEMSQDLTNLIQASNDAIGATSPKTSQIQHPISQYSPNSKPSPSDAVEISQDLSTTDDNLSVISPTVSSHNRNSPLSEGDICMQVDSVTSLKDDKEDPINRSITQSSSPNTPISPDSTSRFHSSAPSPTEAKAKSEGGESISSVKEEPYEEAVKSSPIQYPPTSQDIINQLNSLSASGIPSIGNIQNLANSLSNSLSDANLQDAHLSTLSLNLSESLASSLNLSVAGGTGLDGSMITTTPPTSSQLNQTFGGMTPSKLEFLSRLEGNDKPSMLSMVGAQNRPSASSIGSAGAAQELLNPALQRTRSKQFPCSVCPKGFSRRRHLENHIRTHTGERPFLCEMCGRRFSDSSNYRKHIKKVSANTRCDGKVIIPP